MTTMLYPTTMHLTQVPKDFCVLLNDQESSPKTRSQEITPPGFTTYRKDRASGWKGGVFIMIRNHLIATECNISVSEAELLWIEIHIQGHRPLIIGSFYRPPNSAPSNLQQLADNIVEIQHKFKNAVLVVAGDFNLGDIDWIHREVKPYANESSKCSLLLDICNEHFLDQTVTEPTRIADATQNILDLVLTSHSNFIETCSVTDGISDHLMVCFTLNLKPKANKKQPRIGPLIFRDRGKRTEFAESAL